MDFSNGFRIRDKFTPINPFTEAVLRFLDKYDKLQPSPCLPL